MSELAEFASIDATKKALTKALRQLEEAKHKKADYVTAVYDAAIDALQSLVLPPVSKPKADRRSGGETAVLLLSDWQLAKTTPSYNTATCEQRIELLAEKVRILTQVQRADHPVKECHVYLIGDLIEGELIFPGQAHLIDASLYAQVLSDGPRILGGLLRSLAAEFDRVRVCGVIGNHGSLGGRARRDYHPESNADSMMYEVTRLALQDEPRITWAPNSTPGERHWYAIDEVRGKKFFMFHGDQIKGGFGGIPWYGFNKKLQSWRNMYGFDYAVSGHFHTPVREYLNGLTHWGNGSTESDNTYAAENLAASGEPSQWLLYVGDEGVTAEYLVHLG